MLDPSSMEQYATAETWKNCNLRSKHYVWDDMNCLNKNSCASNNLILIFRTKRSWILFRIGPERRREAEMPTDPCLFSNSPDPIVPVLERPVPKSLNG
uniref:Ycf15 n=1 Tax=Cenchrus purpureus TaxID=154765 RepID=A0A4D6FYJ0_9POAL|nr:Ycf15 [Cenchrus purpureus]